VLELTVFPTPTYRWRTSFSFLQSATCEETKSRGLKKVFPSEGIQWQW